MIKAIIVDDENDSRQILASYVQKYCHDVLICGLANSVATGISLIQEHKPDLVFLDIEMPHGNGFDLLEQVEEISFETIFVTAFDHYAIQALNLSAAYYLLKPVDIDELIKAVEKVKTEKESNQLARHSRMVLENAQTGNSKIMLPTMEGFEIVTINTILYCEAHDNFTKFILEANAMPLLICRPLKYFEEVLQPNNFLRIHRSHLINPNHVVRYSKGKGGSVTMKDNRELEISPQKKKEFLDLFSK